MDDSSNCVLQPRYLVLAVIIVFTMIYFYLDSGKVVLYRFYRPKCPYCVNSQEEWDKFKDSIKFSLKYKAVDINQDLANDTEQELARKFQVKGVPTVIKLYPNWTHVEYAGPRTAEHYLNFIKQ